jgi:hypothetical protein
VKYVWLGPLLLEKAGAQAQHECGGRELTDTNLQYRNRGLALAEVCNSVQKVLNA